MTTIEPRPALKSLTPATDQPSPAEPAATTSGRGAPKVAAEGVPICCSSLTSGTSRSPG